MMYLYIGYDVFVTEPSYNTSVNRATNGGLSTQKFYNIYIVIN